MNDSLNNKELVAVGHQFAKAISSDTAIIDMAKMFTRLAERLDCTTAALREMTKQRDALATENCHARERHIFIRALALSILEHSGGRMDWRGAMEDATELLHTVDSVYAKTPATDAFLAEARRATVTLPTGYSVRPGHPINETERSVMIPKDGGQWLSRFDVEHALRMAGISIKGGVDGRADYFRRVLRLPYVLVR